MFRALMLLALAAPAAAAGDCDAPAPWHVLKAASAPAEARAVWLDARTLRWPGVAEGRFLLQRDAGPPLALSPAPPRPALAPWVAAGAELQLPPLPAATLRDLHRGTPVLVQTDAQGREQARTRLQHALALDDLYAAAETAPPLGASVGRDGTTFRLWAPTAHRVQLCLYADDAAPSSARHALKRDDATGVWTLRRRDAPAGRFYTYLVDVPVPGVGLVRNRVTDPYSAALGADSRRSAVADLDAPRFTPPGWAAAPRPPAAASPTDAVIYELHVRDFSRDDATVPPADRGRYLGFTHPQSAGMRHLRALAEAGLTDIHLLPVFDFATVPERGCVTPQTSGTPDGREQQAAVRAVADRDCFNWGYDPFHFNAPEGSYASDAADPAARIIEFRRLVMALHAAGLRVGMDVVYNHTTASGQHARSVLDRIVPGYYHRLDAAGAVERSTCCGNTATEHRMMARLMIDSAVHWVRHFRIDGFRFDLMGHQPRAAMERLQRAVDAAAGRRIPLIGEGWNFGEVADGRRFVQASQLSLPGSGIATFSDRARDAVRGGGAGDDCADQVARQGWSNGLFFDPNPLARGTRDDLQHAADLVRVGLGGTLRGFPRELRYGDQPAGYAAEPSEVVNYVENHDNQTLFDANAFKLPPGTPREERARAQLLASAVVAFSQGVAYFHAGQDILRSKSMDRNSYDSGDAFNRLDWSLQDNGFGAGLPPEPDNGRSWPLMAPRLADPAIKPTPAEIRWSRDAFLDLLRIRASTPLLRLPSAAEIRRRVSFPDTGSGALVAVRIDGRGLPGARFGGLMVLINADREARELGADDGTAWTLHPVHAAPGAADRRAAQAAWNGASRHFTVPARTAVVFVASGETP